MNFGRLGAGFGRMGAGGLGVPSWVLNAGGLRPKIDLDFANGRYFGKKLSDITCSRASVGWADDASGNWTQFLSNVPRITNKGLLVEEARTNILLQSQDFTTTWASANGGTASKNVSLAPDGTTTGGLVTAVGVTSGRTQSVTISGSAGTLTAISIFAKPGTANLFFLRFSDGTTPRKVWFNAATGAVGTVNGASGNFTAIAAITPQAAANGWWRFGVILTTTTFTSLSIQMVPCQADGGDAVNGDTIGVWQAQAEAGGSVTSITPTATATVARAADVCSISGLTFPAAYWLYAEGTPQAPTSFAGNQSIGAITEGTGNNRFVLFRNTGSAATIVAAFSGGVNQGLTSPSATWAQNASGKFAAALATNDASAVFNGGVPGTSNVVTLPVSPNGLQIGMNGAGAGQFNGFIKRIAQGNGRPINAALQSVTT